MDALSIVGIVRSCGQRRQYLEQRLLHDSYVYMLCKVQREARKRGRINYAF